MKFLDIRYHVLVFSLIVLTFMFSVNSVLASEGRFQLKNTIGTDARCEGASVLMQDLNFHVIMSCWDIIYPGDTQVVSYVIWAQNTDGDVDNVGTLGVGKVEFEVDEAFTRLYVTKEITNRVREPQGSIVMQGNIQDFELRSASTTNAQFTDGDGDPNSTATPSPTIEPEQSKRSPLNIFRIGGAIAFLALAGIIGVVLVITRR